MKCVFGFFAVFLSLCALSLAAVPDAPLQVTAYGYATGCTQGIELFLYWAPVDGATSYEVYWSLSSFTTGTWTLFSDATEVKTDEIVKSTVTNVPSEVESRLQSTISSVYLRVKAKNADGASGLSEYASIRNSSSPVRLCDVLASSSTIGIGPTGFEVLGRADNCGSGGSYTYLFAKYVKPSGTDGNGPSTGLQSDMSDGQTGSSVGEFVGDKVCSISISGRQTAVENMLSSRSGTFYMAATVDDSESVRSLYSDIATVDASSLATHSCDYMCGDFLDGSSAARTVLSLLGVLGLALALFL